MDEYEDWPESSDPEADPGTKGESDTPVLLWRAFVRDHPDQVSEEERRAVADHPSGAA